nr:MAG: putative silencing suppressor protein [Tombusviridae sp.]
MENSENWVLHPSRCDICDHSTYLRECWRVGQLKASRFVRLESQPCSVSEPAVQSWPWDNFGGVTAAVLHTSGGLSYTVRGHGVTVTVSGKQNDVYNITRVAHDVVNNPVIAGKICVHDGPGPREGGHTVRCESSVEVQGGPHTTQE